MQRLDSGVITHGGRSKSEILQRLGEILASKVFPGGLFWGNNIIDSMADSHIPWEMLGK